MTRALLLLALAACGDDNLAPRAELPGTIWAIEGEAPSMLVRIGGGVRSPIGASLYPSTQTLPDGRLVAIASRGDGSSTAEQLVFVSVDGKVERFGPAASQLRDPAVDKHGRWIVVAASFDGHSELYRIHLTGTVTRLTNNAEGNYRPTLAGDSIVYVSSRDGDSEIYRDDTRLTAFHRDDWEATPSPDGSTIAFLSDRDGTARIYLMNADGTDLRRLTTHAGEESAPTWSADGKQLAYVMNQQVWVLDVARGLHRAITPPGATDVEPTFSPDGRWVAVSRERGHTNDVWAMPLEAGEPVLVAQNARLPRWLR
jgi:TolB protein